MVESLSIIEGLKIALYGFVTVFIMLAILMLIIRVLAAVVSMIETSRENKAAKIAAQKAMEDDREKEFVGELQLIDVDEKTAACLMAIISEETAIPLDNLIFKRIELMKEGD